jgi:hypothetical protein
LLPVFDGVDDDDGDDDVRTLWNHLCDHLLRQQVIGRNDDVDENVNNGEGYRRCSHPLGAVLVVVMKMTEEDDNF